MPDPLLAYPVQERPRPGETAQEARARRARNRAARAEHQRYRSELCMRCGEVRGNVVHERDPEHSIEGPEYYAQFADELHPFEPSGAWSTAALEKARWVAPTTVGGTEG